MEIMILAADTPEDARLQIEAGLNKIASMIGPDTNGRTKSTYLGGFAVVIDGDTLRYALDMSLKQLFLNLGTQCDTVVCCRVSPAQKALTVKLVCNVHVDPFVAFPLILDLYRLKRGKMR
jgi:phospholipid-translocating ATPase